MYRTIEENKWNPDLLLKSTSSKKEKSISKGWW